jgi:superfamily II DNA/RNA helicase
VVHVDPPAEHKAYLHRSGRTARAGATGDVVTITLPSQKDDLRVILRKAAIAATPRSVTATSPEVMQLVGEVAPYVAPAPKTAQSGGRGNGAGGRSGRRAEGSTGHARGRNASGRSDSSRRADASRNPEERSGSQVRGSQTRAGRDGGSDRRSSNVDGMRGTNARSNKRTSADSASHRGGQAARGGAGRSIRVGDVVRPNAGTSRGRGPRRSQG